MKKLLILVAAFTLSAGVFAQDKMEKKKGKMDHNMNKKMDHKMGMMKDCVMMEDGKMMVMKGGKTMTMDKDMTMKNGAMVRRSGSDET